MYSACHDVHVNTMIPEIWFTSHEQKINGRSRPSDVFLGKGVLKICSKFTGEHPCRSATSIIQ